jgi:hypothetical protein
VRNESQPKEPGHARGAAGNEPGAGGRTPFRAVLLTKFFVLIKNHAAILHQDEEIEGSRKNALLLSYQGEKIKRII